MSKHTPGPWEAVEIEEGLFHIHSPKGNRHNPVPVAVLDHHRDGDEGTRTVTTPSNAQLIAAAPELADALWRLLQQMPTDARLEDDYAQYIANGYAALKKAGLA